MGYTKEHTRATRERILDSAARLFRRDGYDAARIDEIMAGAGLTRGGFYAHFRSKADLFAAYVGRELDFGRQLARVGADQALDFYLSPGNRRRVARGCTVVSNAADVARSTPQARRAFTRAFAGMRDAFREAADGAGADAPEDAALAAVATCVGGVVLGRALADEALVERLLAACRRSAARDLEGG
ncbi:MAG: TetR family transcriptional regulator [Myxococcota bacterium]